MGAKPVYSLLFVLYIEFVKESQRSKTPETIEDVRWRRRRQGPGWCGGAVPCSDEGGCAMWCGVEELSGPWNPYLAGDWNLLQF